VDATGPSSGTYLARKETRVARRASKRTFGNMRRLASGRYQARYVGPTGETVTAPTTFTARIDAEAWLAAERRQVENPENWQSPKARLEEARREAEANRLPILRDYAEQWIDTARGSRSGPSPATSTRDALCPLCGSTCCGTRHQARTACCSPPTATRLCTCPRRPSTAALP
jgi:hypothetical protein